MYGVKFFDRTCWIASRLRCSQSQLLLQMFTSDENLFCEMADVSLPSSSRGEDERSSADHTRLEWMGGFVVARQDFVDVFYSF